MLRRDQVEFFGNKASHQLQHTKTSALKLHSEQLLAWADVSVMALRWLCWGPPTPMFGSALPHVVVPRHPFLPIPYSLRRGGATSAFRFGVSFDQLLVRGRWSNQKTARIYLDEALQQ